MSAQESVSKAIKKIKGLFPLSIGKLFSKSLYELVNEGLHNKLYRMPGDARLKLRETLERIINEGCSGLICLIL